MRRHLRSDVEKLLEFFPGGRLKAGYIAAEFIGVENLSHSRLKARELGSKIRILIRCPGEGWQLLADQIVQRVFDAETLTNRGRNRALLLPDLVKVHGNSVRSNYIACCPTSARWPLLRDICGT